MSDLLTRLSHVCLTTPNLDRLLGFYVDLLGCRIIHTFQREDGMVYGHFLQIAPGSFLEVFVGEIDPCPRQPSGTSVSRWRTYRRWRHAWSRGGSL